MWNCCFRESKYSQAASSSQLKFAYKRCCGPSLKPGAGFSAAAAMFWGNQRSKFVEVVGLSRTNRYVNGILINFNNFENSMPKALYIANSLLQLDTPRCFYFEGEGAAWSFISSSQQSSYSKKIIPLYRRSLRTWFDYKKPGADRLPKKNHFRESNLQNASNIKKNIFTPYYHAKHRSFHRTRTP